ncbi:hypothetical protein WME94_04075 [Sorangium sp. So ce429]
MEELLDVVSKDDLAEPTRQTDVAIEAECPHVVSKERRIRARRFAHSLDEPVSRERLWKTVRQEQVMRLIKRQRQLACPARERVCQGEEISAGEQPAAGTCGEQPSHIARGDVRDGRRGNLHASAASIPPPPGCRGAMSGRSAKKGRLCLEI